MRKTKEAKAQLRLFIAGPGRVQGVRKQRGNDHVLRDWGVVKQTLHDVLGDRRTAHHGVLSDRLTARLVVGRNLL